MGKKGLFLYFFILFFAAFLRLYHLDIVPPGINQDEGSIGYSAYSIIMTGKDEYGRAFPLSFQSFGDWKLPFYIYATIPIVAILGMTELSVRLLSAMVGIATVGITFFLVYELFGNKRLAFLSMILLAIAPWHLHISRVESEANTAVLFVTFGTLLFLKGIRQKHWLLVPSAILFALTYYTYAGNHVFTTLFLIGMILLYWRKIPRSKVTAIACGIFLILFSVIVYFTLFEASKTKISGIGIFGDPSVVHAKIEIPRNEHTTSNSLPAKLFHNKAYFAFEKFIQNYLNAFSPEFLFIKGGANSAHNIEGFGNMYLIESVFLLVGFIYLVSTKKSQSHVLILFWFLIAPIAPSITKDAPHSNRMFAIFPVLSIVTAFGIYWIVNRLAKKEYVQKLCVLGIICLFALNFGKYIDQYYVHFPRNEGAHWGIGYKRLLSILETFQYQSKKVIMSRPEYSHYIYLLFYEKYDPIRYQREAVRYPPTSDGFYHVRSYDVFNFRTIDWLKDLKKGNIVVAFSKEVPENIRHSNVYKTSEVILDNNESMFTVIESK